MADYFTPIDEAGGWWQLRRSFDEHSEPSGFVLVVKRKDQRSTEFRGDYLPALTEDAVAFCEGHTGPPIEAPKRRKKVRR